MTPLQGVEFVGADCLYSQENVCVRWEAGMTVRDLVSVVKTLAKSDLLVTLDVKAKHLLAPLGLRQRRLFLSTPLWTLQGKTLEASTVRQRLRGSPAKWRFVRKPLGFRSSRPASLQVGSSPGLKTDFCYALPRVGVDDLPLLVLRRKAAGGFTARRVQDLLASAPRVELQWPGASDPVEFAVPSAELLLNLFPNFNVRAVEVADAATGLLQHFPVFTHSFPWAKSAYRCADIVKVRISRVGLELLRREQEKPSREAVLTRMLLTRPPRDASVEQDPTLVLAQLREGAEGEALWEEVVLHWEAADAVSGVRTFAGLAPPLPAFRNAASPSEKSRSRSLSLSSGCCGSTQ